MIYSQAIISELTAKHGSPLYVFDEKSFVQNYTRLLNSFRKLYSKYNIAYSYKTNYTPYVCKIVKELGGYAEVVSGMEYDIAKKIGYNNGNIIFNGPCKQNDGIQAFLNGSIINVDNREELETLCRCALEYPDKLFHIGIRVNVFIGQNFISRFGFDTSELSYVFKKVDHINNLQIIGLHCHISRCRDLYAWKKRAEFMLSVADKYFETPPQYIDLGSGMFGDMSSTFSAQFKYVPTYEEYAECTAGVFANHYLNYTKEEQPELITEPGTTLINKYIDLIAKVISIKKVRDKSFAILNCSVHNLGETCLLKKLPIQVFDAGKQKYYEDIDLSGYTCLEQDVMLKDYIGKIGIDDILIFENVGGYSNVLKPPFIYPNCAMIALRKNLESVLIKRAETYSDILQTYIY